MTDSMTARPRLRGRQTGGELWKSGNPKPGFPLFHSPESLRRKEGAWSTSIRPRCYPHQTARRPLNAIVLFTDGLPNGITANFNNTATTVIKSGSHCINKKDNGNSTLSMLGWMAQWGGFVSGGSADGHGIFSLAQTTVTSTQSSVTNWLIHGTEPTIASPPSQGCDYALPLSSGPPPT